MNGVVKVVHVAKIALKQSFP